MIQLLGMNQWYPRTHKSTWVSSRSCWIKRSQNKMCVYQKVSSWVLLLVCRQWVPHCSGSSPKGCSITVSSIIYIRFFLSVWVKLWARSLLQPAHTQVNRKNTLSLYYAHLPFMNKNVKMLIGNSLKLIPDRKCPPKPASCLGRSN